jgi:hypothetical protein
MRHHIFICSVLMSSLYGCKTLPTVTGSGEIRNDKRIVADFDEVEVRSDLMVEMTSEVPANEVDIRGDDNLLSTVKTTVEGGTLKMEVKCDCIAVPSSPILVRIGSANIDTVSAYDKSNIKLTSQTFDEISFNLYNKAILTVENVTAEFVEVNASDDSQAVISGKTDEFVVEATDDANVRADKLVAESATIDSSDDADIALKVISELDANLEDDSVLHLESEPKVSNTKVDDDAVIERRF